MLGVAVEVFTEVAAAGEEGAGGAIGIGAAPGLGLGGGTGGDGETVGVERVAVRLRLGLRCGGKGGFD